MQSSTDRVLEKLFLVFLWGPAFRRGSEVKWFVHLFVAEPPLVKNGQDKENLLNDAIEVAQLAQTEGRRTSCEQNIMEAVSLFIKVIQQETHMQRRAAPGGDAAFIERAEDLDNAIRDQNDPLLQEARLLVEGAKKSEASGDFTGAKQQYTRSIERYLGLIKIGDASNTGVPDAATAGSVGGRARQEGSRRSQALARELETVFGRAEKVKTLLESQRCSSPIRSCAAVRSRQPEPKLVESVRGPMLYTRKRWRACLRCTSQKDPNRTLLVCGIRRPHRSLAAYGYP